MKPKEWLASLGTGTERDAILAIRAEQGKNFRGYLAGVAGVSRDTAGRWLQWAEGRGGQRPNPKVMSRVESIKKAGNRVAAARKIRSIRSIRPRQVAVSSKSPIEPGPDGFRQIDTAVGLDSIRDEIAEAWAAGDEDRAAELLDQALIAGYSGEDVRDDSGLASLLTIDDFRVNPDVTYE